MKVRSLSDADRAKGYSLRPGPNAHADDQRPATTTPTIVAGIADAAILLSIGRAVLTQRPA